MMFLGINLYTDLCITINAGKMYEYYITYKSRHSIRNAYMTIRASNSYEARVNFKQMYPDYTIIDVC